jgi:hypothetical protein
MEANRTNSSWDSTSKNPSQKRADGVAQGLVPEFKSQYHKKRKKREREREKDREWPQEGYLISLSLTKFL